VAPRPILESASKSLPYWSTGNGDDTMVTVWNPADEAQDYALKLFFSGGHYTVPIHLEARATRTFNISEIIQSQVPDADGNSVPATVREGSMKITGGHADNEHILVAMDGGIYNVRKATCQGETCVTCDGATSYSVAANPFGVPVGGQTQLNVTDTWCAGTQYNLTSSSSWASDNTSVATVQTGMTHGVSAGSANISATNQSEPICARNVCYNGVSPCPVGKGGGGSAPGTVTPSITSVDPTITTIGSNSVQITINGSGFGTSATVNLPSGFNSTGQGTTDTRIVITVNIAFTARVGNNSITVSANGQTSNSATFQVDGPYHMIVQSDTTGKCSGCTTTVRRLITYQIQNFSGTNAGTTAIGEIVTTTGWSCTQSNAGFVSTPCSANSQTTPLGTFIDGWTLASDGYTPRGCGENVTDHWQWCAHSPAQTLGTLTGYAHTNAISENGVVSPSHMPPGTVVPF
jgi:hypothetical protein